MYLVNLSLRVGCEAEPAGGANGGRSVGCCLLSQRRDSVCVVATVSRAAFCLAQLAGGGSARGLAGQFSRSLDRDGAYGRRDHCHGAGAYRVAAITGDIVGNWSIHRRGKRRIDCSAGALAILRQRVPDAPPIWL